MSMATPRSPRGDGLQPAFLLWVALAFGGLRYAGGELLDEALTSRPLPDRAAGFGCYLAEEERRRAATHMRGDLPGVRPLEGVEGFDDVLARNPGCCGDLRCIDPEVVLQGSHDRVEHRQVSLGPRALQRSAPGIPVSCSRSRLK